MKIIVYGRDTDYNMQLSELPGGVERAASMSVVPEYGRVSFSQWGEGERWHRTVIVGKAGMDRLIGELEKGLSTDTYVRLFEHSTETDERNIRRKPDVE